MAMLVHSLNFPFSNHNPHYVQNLRIASSSSPTRPRSNPSMSIFFTSSHSVCPCRSIILRRSVLLSISTFVVIVVAPLLLCSNRFPSSLSMAVANQVLSLERYTDPEAGFTLLRPSSWIKVNKAGATVLFEEVNKGSNSVGIVISPVRISSLGEFGTPQFVADKLIEAEKRKESTKEAEVVSVSERSGKSGLQVYEFEYKIDSTRGGRKRVFSAAFVASKKLYLLNISHSDGLEIPLDTDKRMILEQVLHSFDIAPST